MYYKSILLCLLMVLSLSAMAQEAPPAPAEDAGPTPQQRMEVMGLMNAMRRAPRLSPVIAAGPKYLYLLCNGIVAEYDGLSDKPVKQHPLYGTLPAQPAAEAPLDVRLKYGLEVARRLEAATMLVSGDDLVIATNDLVFCLDAVTLQQKTATNLPLLDPATNRRWKSQAMTLSNAPVVQVIGHLACVSQGDNRLLLVDLHAGKVLSQKALPTEMVPTLLIELNDLFAKEINQGDGWHGGGNGPFVNPPGGDAPKAVTLVGTVHHVDLEGGFWAFDERNGQKFVLAGDKLKELAATPNIEGARVRLTGTVNNNPGIAQYGNGSFTFTDFQVMPAAN